jgi:uncharacterized protein YyaL (SSP411 family)
MSQAPAYTNRLEHETSPYLRQHAHNPVDWYPWGEEALARARELNRPIFLSIGYSACHWCHVMEHESFEDPAVAAILNENFVSIKVDREERPDLDQIYMTAVQRMTRQGGWPMSMFLTPDLKPFYGGTYFPPDDRYGRPSFKSVLSSIVEAWRDQKEAIHSQAEQITEDLQTLSRVEPPSEPGALAAGALATDGPQILRGAASYLSRAFDRVHGGFGSAPKFPHPMDLRLLLRVWKRFGDSGALDMVEHTLDHMAMGGIYDQLGGGFHRYSTDERWLVPHFEKMLYDNALLTSAYTEAFLATGRPLYREVVEETLAYVQREMTSPEGFFFSTQDADSEGVEGKFFVWSAAEVEQALGHDLADVFGYFYGIMPEGNWEGHNILNRTKTLEQDSRMLKIAEPDLRRLMEEGRRKLYEVRSRRVWPGRDEKALTSWNGLMIVALAQASLALDVPAHAETAARAANFILKKMRTRTGRLLRTYSTGSEPKLNAYLEDYSFLIDGLVSLYEATFRPHWIEAALDLAEVMIEQFWDTAAGGFFYTGQDHERLIARTKDPHDSSVPSGSSLAVLALLRLHRLTGRIDLLEKAEATLRLFQGLMAESPYVAGQMLIALDFYLGPVAELAVVGDPTAADTRRVLRSIFGQFRPNRVVALRSTRAEDQAPFEAIGLLTGKPAGAEVTTYICENFTCRTPLVGAAAAEAELGKSQSSIPE